MTNPMVIFVRSPAPALRHPAAAPGQTGVNPSSTMNRPMISSCLLAIESQGDCCT